MSMATETDYEHMGDTRGCADHDHDMIHELSRRLDGVWRYDQYITNADGKPDLRKFWRNVKGHEQETIEQLKRLLKEHIQNKCF
jgi:hypothetical protein